MGVAYLLWGFFGLLGAHRLYLEKRKSGLAMLALTVLGLFTTPIIGLGTVLLAAVAVWALIDAFLIPGMVRAHKREAEQGLRMDSTIAGLAEMPVDTSNWSAAEKERFIAALKR